MSVFEKDVKKKALGLIENRIKYCSSYYGDAANEYAPMLQACREALLESMRIEPRDGDMVARDGDLAIIEYANNDGSPGLTIGYRKDGAWALHGASQDVSVVRWGRPPKWIRDGFRVQEVLTIAK